jgi:ATP-dependent DNA helicase RecG
VERWLRPKLPQVIDRSQMTRRERPALPFELVREAIINALVHRDYDLTGATCHLIVTTDTVTIRSPGAPLPPITVEQMQAFTAPMYNRNPKLQFAFGGTKLAEGRGLGMKTLGEAASKYGLPVPKYAFDGVYLNLTIYRHREAAVRALGGPVLERLSKSERSGWEWLATKEKVTSQEYSAARNIPNRTALHHLKRFTELGLLQRVGSGPSTVYHLLRQ